jgi:predicted MPP superfamily phosphohydrolase
MQFALLVFTILGHGFLWVGIINRLHALVIPRRLMKTLTLGCFAMMGAGPLMAILWFATAGDELLQFDRRLTLNLPRSAVLLYAALCWIAGTATLARWLRFRLLKRLPDSLRPERRSAVVITRANPGSTNPQNAHHKTTRLPGNQTLRLQLTELAFAAPGLPSALDGLRIVHMSDLHFTGLVGKAYFHEVVRISNNLAPDIVAITGDIVDRVQCVSWGPEILGQLCAKYGVYAILGNHDLYVDEAHLRRTLADCGLIDVGRRWVCVNVRGEEITVAGNELPWFTPAADLENCPRQFRILLAHSPDQLQWARTRNVNLMLSGHTHGGQICLPVLGPIFAPTAKGVKYIYGLYYAAPTILHVTRGVSAEYPLRWNCAPEIALLTLRSPIQDRATL